MDVEHLKTDIVDNKWKINDVPTKYNSAILQWLQKTRDEIVKTGWAPNPNISVSIKQLSPK